MACGWPSSELIPSNIPGKKETSVSNPDRGKEWDAIPQDSEDTSQQYKEVIPDSDNTQGFNLLLATGSIRFKKKIMVIHRMTKSNMLVIR